MIKAILVFLAGSVISVTAMAQDYGLAVGIHNTTASLDTSGASLQGFTGSSSSKLGFDAGVLASFELLPSFRFRTGILYDQREFDYKLSNGAGTVSFNFAYVDVPVNVQYNFTEMVGVFGGLIVGIAADNSTSVPGGATLSGLNQKSLYPLVNAGLNFMFNDMIGFDLYYEAGLGNASDYTKNYSTYGLHFIYWL